MKLCSKKIIGLCVIAGSLCMVPAVDSSPVEHKKECHKKVTHKKKRSRTGTHKKRVAPRPLTIQQKIEKIAHSISGEVGVSALHVESGQRIVFNENTKLPMASVCKLAIAICCLEMVDAGRLSLDKKIAIRAQDLWQIDREDERKLLKKKVIYRTVGELIALMMEVSDNPATDIILRLIGGVDTVNACLCQHGVDGMHLDRTILQFVCDYSGYARPTNPYGCTNGHYRKLQAQANKEFQEKAEMRFYADKRDRSTPAAATQLLQKLFSGKLLSAASTGFLLEHMGQSQCHNRLGGLLPEGTHVMHKTGTMVGVTDYAIINDVGIINLPGGKGHLIVSVFINKSNSPRCMRTRAIARIAQVLSEHFSC